MAYVLAFLLSAPVQNLAMNHIDRVFGPNDSAYEMDYYEKCSVLEHASHSVHTSLACLLVTHDAFN